VTGSKLQPSRRSKWLAPGLGAALLTFFIWASSPLLFAQVEPWDTPYPFYSITAFLGGGLLGYRFRGGALLPLFLGAWVGQVVALLSLPGQDRTWFMLGVVTTGIGSLVVLAGAALGALIHRRAAV
jgi:hypothetical protein